jgi:predicted Zn-dependent protease with MMP-like domain
MKDVQEFRSFVYEIVDSLPDAITSQFDNVTIEVAIRPEADHDPSGQGLLGLYEGVSILERGIDYYAAVPDRIIIFYRPHMELDLPEPELRAEIRMTVLHEIGHHLGIGDDRLHEIGWG